MSGTEKEMAEETNGNGRRRRWLLPVLVVVAALVVGFGFKRWSYVTSHESTNDAFVGGHMVPVLARVGATVDDVRFVENQHVNAGDILVVLDTTELQQRVDQAAAELAAAQAAAGTTGSTGQAQAMVEEATRQREAMTARMAAAQATADRAAKDLERVRGLADKQIVSRQQLDAAEASLAEAGAMVQSLEQQRSAASAGISTARAGLRGAEARLESAKAGVASAKLQRSYARIDAPVSGTASRRSVEPGQLLQPGQPLATIVADSGVYVTANFKETQLSELRAGQRVIINVDAYPGCAARGEVQSLGGATGSQFALIPPDNATGNFTKVVQRVPVRISVLEGCGEDRPLRPGMSVVVHVNTGGA
jgi:membrane fusion protein, multidrug efflux system